MKDKLEEFVHDHRDEFDLHHPPDIWRRVDKQLHKKRRTYGVYYPIAASLLLIVGVSVWLMRRAAPPPVVTPTETTAIAISPEIKEAQAYYASIVETKRSELKQFDRDYPDLFRDFNGEMDTLNVAFSQLEIEYKKANGNEAVVQALIQNMQLQVELLNRQMQVIHDIRKHENKKSAKSSLM